MTGATVEMEEGNHAQNSVCVLDSPTGLCVGDSGGPLVCNNTVVGVNSILMPLTCVQSPISCVTSNFFHSFTYLCPYLMWLAEYVPETPPPPISCRASCICVHLIFIYFYCLYCWITVNNCWHRFMLHYINNIKINI